MTSAVGPGPGRLAGLLCAALCGLAGCEGSNAVDGGLPAEMIDAEVEADAAPPVDRGLSPDAAPVDAAPPDPDAGWPDGLDLVALFDAYERGELEPGAVRSALRAAPDAIRAHALPPVVDHPLLIPEGATVALDGPLVITVDGLLALAPGARLEIPAEASIIAEGRLYAVGSEAAPAMIVGDGFDTVELRGGPNTLHRVVIEGGDRLLTVRHGEGLRTRIEHAALDHWVDVALDMPRAIGVELRDSRVGLESAPDEGGEMVRTRGGGAIRIEGNRFGPRRGYRDAIDLQDCVGEWPVLVGNRFAEGEDDAIDLDRCSAFVIANHIRDFRPLDLAARNAGINGGGITGDGDIDIVIVGNVIERCYHGIGFKNGARPVMVNNTIVDGHIGVSLYQSAAGQPMPHGVMINNLLAGNRDWLDDTPQDILLHGRWWPSYNQRDAVQGTLEADHNTLASGGEVPPGVANDPSDPRIERLAGWPVPAEGSPALDSARGDDLPEGAIEWLRRDTRGVERRWQDGRFVDLDRGAIER